MYITKIRSRSYFHGKFEREFSRKIVIGPHPWRRNILLWPPISSFSRVVIIEERGGPSRNVLSRDTRFPSRFYYFPFLLLLLLLLLPIPFVSASLSGLSAFSSGSCALAPLGRNSRTTGECPDREIVGIRGGDLLLSRWSIDLSSGFCTEFFLPSIRATIICAL